MDSASTPMRMLARSLLEEALCQLAGAERTPPLRVRSGPARLRWTLPRIAEAVRAFRGRHERLPTRREWRHAGEHGLPGRATLLAMGWSIDDAEQAAHTDNHRKGA